MTKDVDFVRLLEQHGPTPQVLRLTVGDTSNADEGGTRRDASACARSASRWQASRRGSRSAESFCERLNARHWRRRGCRRGRAGGVRALRRKAWRVCWVTRKRVGRWCLRRRPRRASPRRRVRRLRRGIGSGAAAPP